MLKYIFKRILMMIPVLIGVSIIVFMLQVLTPGDPADMALGADVTEEAKDEWRESYNLNDPIEVQYGKYMFRLITKGDLGLSYRSGTSVNAEIAYRFPISFQLALYGTIVASLIGVPLGIVSAKHRGKILDSLSRLVGIVGISIPIFWFSFLMIMLFAVNLGWFPVSGLYSWKHWVLPVVTLGVLSSASILRVTRSSVLDCISQDYVRTARAKGQAEGVITKHHILRNAMIPITNSIGTQFANGLGGSAIIESVFVLNGLGTCMVTAINSRDYALLRACVLLIAVAVSVVNLLIDVIYTFIDPRVKSRFSSGKRKEAKRREVIDNVEAGEEKPTGKA